MEARKNRKKPVCMMKELIKKLTPLFLEHHVIAAYLFGSRADGTAYPESDYDIALLMEIPKPKNRQYEYLFSLQTEIEEILFPHTVDLIILQRTPALMCYNIIKRGKVIFCTDSEKRTDFEEKVLRDYLDFKPFIDQYEREVEEAIRGGFFFAES